MIFCRKLSKHDYRCLQLMGVGEGFLRSRLLGNRPMPEALPARSAASEATPAFEKPEKKKWWKRWRKHE